MSEVPTPEAGNILRSLRVVAPPHDTLVAAFERAAADRAPYVVFHGAKGPVVRPIREALEGARRWAVLFQDRGAVRGDCVPILLPAGHAFVEAMLGAMLAGAVPVPLATPMSWLPLFHDMGLVGVLLTSICHPYPVHVMSPESFVMRPSRWLDLVSRVRATLSAAPNFAYEMCAARATEAELDDVRLDSWRVALNGAEPVHASTVRRFVDRFTPLGLGSDVVMPVYGMAEATLAVSFPGLDRKLTTLAIDRGALERDQRARPLAGGHPAVSVGVPVAGTAVRVRSEEGGDAPVGGVGEILVQGPSLMDGYFRNEEASLAAISNGWLRTGDLGFLHDGRLFVTGRAKELIIKGGRNLHPYDVERVASEVEGVRLGSVAAFGRPNAESGTDDLVVVIESTGADADRRARLASAVRGELLAVLGVKPDEVRVCPVGTVPRTTSGKVRRGECARLFACKESA
jgi:acyl-CoA synthetase (AMP-forming)/AMP-acid ligase II